MIPDDPLFSLNRALRECYGAKTMRIPVSLHRPCPNRTDGKPGCVFCLPESYEPPAERIAGSITGQIDRGIGLHRAAGVEKFIAYFQSGSNTFGPTKELLAAYREALEHPGIVGISISTRPDCLAPDMLDAIRTLAVAHDVWIELGVQTAQDRTLALLRRNHTAACSIAAARQVLDAGVAHVVLHMILGLPGETEEEMQETFRAFAALRPGWDGKAMPRLGFKIHHLQVVRGTEIEAWWREGRVPVYDLDAYARLVVDMLEQTPPDIVVHRMFGSVPEHYLCAPRWSGSKAAQLGRILREFKLRGTFQGNKYRAASDDTAR